MLLKQHYKFEDDQIYDVATHDWQPEIDLARTLRDVHEDKGGMMDGELRPVASFPMELWHDLCRQKGVKPGTPEADEVAQNIARDPDYCKFHVLAPLVNRPKPKLFLP